ncbi:DUF1120 domain-containing protein [Enterobacteriaceae bacterium 89]|nr:DUF1120 domain-containing protein [Enterobacteriaceae bacterium 89]
MKKIQLSLCALAVLATTALSVQAASNVEVKVIGRIDPGTCTPSLTGGGVVDYGTMSPSVVAATGYTVLPLKEVPFSVSCTAPSKVAIYAVNNRPNTVPDNPDYFSGGGSDIPASVTLLNGSHPRSAGLGISGNSRVGGYTLGLKSSSLKADGVKVDQLLRYSTSDSWAVRNGDSYVGMFTGVYEPTQESFATSGQSTPVAFTTLTGTLGVQAFLNQRSQLDLSNTVLLDGSTTLELVYLP